ncbi:MAG: glycosyltransferase family 9 protein, partial [Pseudonocardia sp.]|nr:glycosyltransferase family 9 protein [Pseudonocardia sp.]
LGLGDLLAAVPALRALHAAFPNHQLTLATPTWLHPLCDLLEGWHRPVAMAGLGDQLPADLPKIDIAVNLHGNGATSAALLASLAPRRRIGHRRPGWSGPPWRPELPERARWCRLLAAHGIPADPTNLRLRPPPAQFPGAVLVHPGAGYGAKRWPPDRFAAVAACYAAAGTTVLITGSRAERPLAYQVAALADLPETAVLAGRIPILELAALVASARLLLSGDTGIAHLGYAFGTPSITLFGPVDAHRWGPPPGGPHHLLQRPEARRGNPFADHPDPALLALTVDDVLVATDELGVIPARGTRGPRAGRPSGRC